MAEGFPHSVMYGKNELTQSLANITMRTEHNMLDLTPFLLEAVRTAIAQFTHIYNIAFTSNTILYYIKRIEIVLVERTRSGITFDSLFQLFPKQVRTDNLAMRTTPELNVELQVLLVPIANGVEGPPLESGQQYNDEFNGKTNKC